MSESTHAFFDFDGTLIEGDSLLFWLRYYYRLRPWRRVFLIANWLGLILYLLKIISSHTLKRVFLWPNAFEKPETLESMTSAFVREDLVFRFHRLILERLWTHHFLGHKVVVISASGTFYLKHIQGILPPCLVVGTEMVWGKGVLGFPGFRGGNLRGENKVIRLRELGMAETANYSFAYSDHPHDMPLLRFADFPICVRPTARLRRRARSFGWPVWDWPGERPVWKRRLESLALLLWGWAPESLDRSGSVNLPGLPDPGQSARFLPMHIRALRERVEAKGPEALDAVFGPKRLTPRIL